jgi:hypothetical protein
MGFLRWIIVSLALIEAGWMAFDGTRALVVGNYVTPKDGRLGPWSKVVSSIGIEPRSTLMKTVFSVFGTIWLIVTIAFAANLGWANTAMFVCAVASLWYLPLGTILGLLQILLLAIWRHKTGGV